MWFLPYLILGIIFGKISYKRVKAVLPNEDHTPLGVMLILFWPICLLIFLYVKIVEWFEK